MDRNVCAKTSKCLCHTVGKREFKLWVESHKHEFVGEVYRPIAKEMEVTNELHAKYLNNSIGLSVFYGYVLTLAMQLRSIIYFDYVQRQNGIEGYLNDICEAPNINLNMHAYAMHDFRDRSMDIVLLTMKGQSNRLRHI